MRSRVVPFLCAALIPTASAHAFDSLLNHIVHQDPSLTITLVCSDAITDVHDPLSCHKGGTRYIGPTGFYSDEWFGPPHLLLTTGLLAGESAGPETRVESQPTAPPEGPVNLDEGQLSPAWFDARRPIEFRKTRVVDYLWVKEGLTLEGQRLHLDKWEPPLRDPEDDEVDRRKAVELTGILPADCLKEWEEVFKGEPACSRTAGGIRVVGRIVDINVKSSFWSSAWPILTFDLKFTDKETGVLLVAMHHRVAQQQRLAMKRWFRKVAEAMNEGLDKAYASGSKAKD